MSPARAQTRTTQFRDEPSNHEAKSPAIIKYWKLVYTTQVNSTFRVH